MRLYPGSGSPISLRKLLPGATFVGADDIAVDACAADFRRVEPESTFVWLPEHAQEHPESVHRAVERGCTAVLSERPVSGVGVPLCLVPDVLDAYGRLCQALAGDPSRRLKVIAVAGTNGKTTTSCLIASILRKAGVTIGVLGGLGCVDGREVISSFRTIPPADEFAGLLARMIHQGCSHAVVEVSGRALSRGRMAGVQFDAACMAHGGRACEPMGTGTSRRRDSRGSTHGAGEPVPICSQARDVPQAHAAGSRLHSYRMWPRLLAHLAAEGLTVINADDSGSIGCLPKIDGPVLTVGLHAAAEIRARIVEHSRSEQMFLLIAGSEAVAVRTRMIGTRHVYCCLTAAAIGLAYGIELVTVARGLEAVDYVPGRLERIECGQPFGVFVEEAHTPNGLAAALGTLREVTDGRLICVLRVGSDSSRMERALMGRTAERNADLAVITSDDPRNPQTILQDLASRLRSPVKAEIIPERGLAIGWALNHARQNDVVLIAGAGRPAVAQYGHERRAVGDCELARKWLYEHQASGV